MFREVTPAWELPVISLCTRLLSGDLEVTIPFLTVCQGGQNMPEQAWDSQQLWPQLNLRPQSRAKVGLTKVALNPQPKGK